MAAPQNGPIEITRTVADVEGMEAPRYEDITGDELAQTVADLSGMSLHDVITDGVQTSLVALHLTGGVPEDRQDLIRLATGESFVRPTAFQRVHPDPNAPGVLVVDVPLDSMTGPESIDVAMGIRSSTANVKPSAAPALAAIPERNVAMASSSNARSQNATDENVKFPPESTHLMRETLFQHTLSRNGPVNREVCNALNKMDCGADLRKTWNDLDKYVTLEDTEEMTKIEKNAKGMAKILHEAQVQLAEAVFKREWSEECPILSLLMPGTRSGGLSGCRFDHPDERSNGPMSSLRVENSKTRCNATPFVLSQICQSSQHLATLIMAFTYVHNDGTGKRVLTTPPLSESKWVTVQHASRQVPSMQDALRSETSEVKAKLTQTLGICTGQHVWVSDGECDYNNAHVLLCRLARGCAVPLSRIKDAGIGQIRALQAPS